MRHIKTLEEALPICSAIGSEVRADILGLLLKHKSLNLDSIAKALHLTNGALTTHIQKLHSAGLINIVTAAGTRGTQKQCSIAIGKILIDINDALECENTYDFEIDVGHYKNFEILPTCGLATDKGIIGELDDPRYFDFPERFGAGLLWFSEGYLEYGIPNALKAGERATELQFSVELASEAPGFTEHYPSDIHFSVMGKSLGYWTCPGEFRDRPGLFTPKWLPPNIGQYGRLKMVVVNGSGTFVDGVSIGRTRIDDLKLTHLSALAFGISSPSGARNRGGVTIFGKTFGDYNCGIKVRLVYEK